MITNTEIENEIKKVSLWACFIHGFASREAVYFTRLRKKLVTLVTEGKKKTYGKSTKPQVVLDNVSSKSQLGKKPEQHLQVNSSLPERLAGSSEPKKELEQTGFAVMLASENKKTSSNILDKLDKDDIARWKYGITTMRHEKIISRKYGRSFVYAIREDLGINLSQNAQVNAKVNPAKESNTGYSFVELEAEIQRGIKKVWGVRSFFRGRSKKFLYVEDRYSVAKNKTLNDRDKLTWQIMLKDETCKRALKEVCGRDYQTFLEKIEVDSNKSAAITSVSKMPNDASTHANIQSNLESKVGASAPAFAEKNDERDVQAKAEKKSTTAIEAWSGNNQHQRAACSSLLAMRATSSIIQNELCAVPINNMRDLFSNFMNLDRELPMVVASKICNNKKPFARKKIVNQQTKVNNKENAGENCITAIEAWSGNNQHQSIVSTSLLNMKSISSIIQNGLGAVHNMRGRLSNIMKLYRELPIIVASKVCKNKNPLARKQIVNQQAKVDNKKNADKNRIMAIKVWGRELPIVIASRGCDNKKQFAQEEVVERQVKVDKEENVDKPDIEFARKGRFLDVPEINKYLDKLDDAVVLFQFEIEKACTDAISSQGVGPDQDKNISVVIKIRETMLNLVSIATDIMRINLFASCENAASIQYDGIIGEIKSKFDKVCDEFSVKESDLSIPIGFLDLDFNEVLRRGRQSCLNLGEELSVPVDAVKDLSVIKASIAWLEKLFCKNSARIEEPSKQAEEIALTDDVVVKEPSKQAEEIVLTDDVVVKEPAKQAEEIVLTDDVVAKETVEQAEEIALTDDDVVKKESNTQTNAVSAKESLNNNVSVSATAGSNAHIPEVLKKNESDLGTEAKANSDNNNASKDIADIAHTKDGLWQQPGSPFTPSKSKNKRREVPSSPSRTTRGRDLCNSPCKTAAVIKGIV